MKFSKRGGIVGEIVDGTGGLIISVVLILVVLSTLLGANLLTANSNEKNATDRLMGNFTSGIDNISAKIPTIFLIAAVVILFGALVLLVQRAKGMTSGGQGTL
jgi:predicted RND superfamily exporter protein